MKTRTCPGCKEEFPLTEEFFYRNNTREDCGFFHYRCKPCSKGICRKGQMKYQYAKYNLTIDGYQQMFEDQNGKCAICQNDQVKLCVDHNHTSLANRGLLCGSCNRFLGLANENIDILIRAIHYLQLHNGDYR